jgi:pyruvate,water dikinase
MQFIRNFRDINKSNVAIAGGKGASLGEMTQAGIAVPSGFVLLSSAFEKFLEITDLNVQIDAILRTVNHQEMHTIENASEKIQALILAKEIPKNMVVEIKQSFTKLGAKYVAVRSSATAEDSVSAAWAGQLDTFLNTTEKNLLKNVKKCWASLFTPRAIFYRFEKKLQKKTVSVAVVVQAMIQSEVSGICFTVHPVTQDHNQMVIEAGFGLGEAIVSGSVTPDTYIIHKDDFSVLDVNVSEQTMIITRSGNKNLHKQLIPKVGGKQKLNSKQIVELAKICKNIEKHYKFPQDIEWALQKGLFYVTQSRPITTL